MENLPINNGNGQSFGFVLYEMTVCSGGRLHANAQDEAQVGLGIWLQAGHQPSSAVGPFAVCYAFKHLCV